MEKLCTRMERLVWDMHQIVLDLESIPGALLPNQNNNKNDESASYHPSTTTPAQHRRVLRRLDRCLQQLESEMIANNHDTSQPENEDHPSSTSLLQEEILSLSSQQRTTMMTMTQPLMTPHSESSAIVHTGTQQSQYHRTVCEFPSQQIIPMLLDKLIIDLKTLLTRLMVPGMEEEQEKDHHPNKNRTHLKEETIPPSLTASILECMARLWQHLPHQNSSTLSGTDIPILLERLLWGMGGYCHPNGNHLVLIQNNPKNPAMCTIVSAWLHVLIHHFQCQHHHHNHHPTEAITTDGETAATRDESTIPLSEPPPNHSDLATTTMTTTKQFSNFVVTIIPAFVRTAQETIHMKPWEPNGIEDAFTEMATQWRILTGYLIEAILEQTYHHHHYQQTTTDWKNSDHQHAPIRSVQEWLEDCFRQVHPTWLVPQIQTCTQEFWSLLHSYVQELTEYALDALDGAAVAFHSSVSHNHHRRRPQQKSSSLVTYYLEQGESQDSIPKKMNCKIPRTKNRHETSLPFQLDSTPTYIHHRTEGEPTQDMETHESMFVSTERAIRDCLRHVELAMNLLEVMHSVYSFPRPTKTTMGDSVHGNDAEKYFVPKKQWMQEPWILSTNLWKTLSTSFLAKSNLTTALNYTNDGNNEGENLGSRDLGGDLWGRICNLQMELAGFVLSTEPQPESSTTECLTGNSGGYEKALALTFLRLLECPELLLSSSMEFLWRRMEQLLVEQPLTIATKDLKRILQVTVLTLRRQYSLPVSRIEIIAGSHPQLAAQAVVDRLLPILLSKPIHTNNPAETDGQAMVVMELWDNYFQQKVGAFLRV